MKENKIKLLTIGHSYVIGVNRSIMREIATDSRFEVTVVAPKFFHGTLRDNFLEDEPKNSPIRLIGIDSYLTQYMHIFFYNLKQLKALLSDNFDLIHIWEEPYILSGYQLARASNNQAIPFSIYTNQSLVKRYPPPFSLFDRWTSNHCAQWIGCGHLVRDAMLQKGWAPEKGEVIPYMVDTSVFRPYSSKDKQSLKSELNLSGMVIGMLGRLKEEKGCDILMKTIERLSPKDDWSLFLMGSGPYESIIKNWALDKGLSDRVQIRLLKHEEVSHVLPVCDILMCPSQTRSFWKEQFGRMIVEAFASGVMVIGSDSGEIPYVIDHAGMIVGETDVEGWVGALKRAMTDSELRQEYIRKGLERAKLFSAKAVAEKYKDLFCSMVD